MAASLTTFVGLLGLFFKWLTSSFKRLEEGIKLIGEGAILRTEKTVQALGEHEDHDQRRHEENLHRFERISVALAKLGSENGTYTPKL